MSHPPSVSIPWQGLVVCDEEKKVFMTPTPDQLSTGDSSQRGLQDLLLQPRVRPQRGHLRRVQCPLHPDEPLQRF